MGLFGKKQLEDKPIDYHAGVVAFMFGGRIATTQLPENQTRFGGAIASVLNLYSVTLPAPALLNMLAIGSGREFTPLWDREVVRSVLTTSAESLTRLKDVFISYSRSEISEIELVNTIIQNMGYPADAELNSTYEEGLLYAAHQILAELAEKVKGDSRNGSVRQIGVDAEIQGVVASMMISLLIACEESQS